MSPRIPVELHTVKENLPALRARLHDAGLTRYDLADRGRFEHNDLLVVPDLFDRLVQLTRRPLTVLRARWLVFRRGDYSLTRGDALSRLPGDHVELTFDLSPASSGEAQVVYTDGASSVYVPQTAGQVSVVARDEGIYRWERYLGLRMGEAVVYRLRLTLR